MKGDAKYMQRRIKDISENINLNSADTSDGVKYPSIIPAMTNRGIVPQAR